MWILDVLIVLPTIAFVIVLGFIQRPGKALILSALMALAIIAAYLSISNNRGLALPALTVSIVFFVASLIGEFLKGEPRKRYVLAGGAAVLGAIGIFPLLLFSASVSFPKLSGTYNVGVRSGEVVDPARGDAWNAIDGGERRFSLRVWYPAEANWNDSSKERNTRLERKSMKAITDSGIDAPKLFSESLSRAKTHAYWDAPVAGGRFPILIFSHGYSGANFANASVGEQVASHGFIVVSITHPGESNSVFYLDGTPREQDPKVAEMFAEHAETDLFGAFGKSFPERLEWVVTTFEPIKMVSERIPVWADDFSSVLTALEQGEFKGDLGDVLDAADFESVGFFGMSAGAGSAPLACHFDERCDAIVALDGVTTKTLRDTTIRAPMLVFDSGVPVRSGAQDLYYEQHAEYGRTPHVTRIDFPNNGHADFTDMTLVLSPLGKAIFPSVLPLLGPVNGPQNLLTQSQLASDFFGIHLKENSPSTFPERQLNDPAVARMSDPAPFQEWYAAQPSQ